MPDASTQTEDKPRRPVSDSTKKKYQQAIKRLEDAKLDLDDTDKVIDWIKTKGGGSAQKVYYSAIKDHLTGKFPKQYQDEIDRLYKDQNEKDDKQELSEKQTENFVPYEKLLEVQKRLADKENKTEKEWKNYVVASLYTLQPPVRADYGEVRVFKRRGSREGNELIFGQKGPAYFVFRKYKTSKTYGTVEVRVSADLHRVLEEWFAHLGKTPKHLLGRPIDGNDLLLEIQSAFHTTQKKIGINLLRHAYIKHHFPGLTTIKQKEDLAAMMLHSKEKQEQYNSQNV